MVVNKPDADNRKSIENLFLKLGNKLNHTQSEKTKS